MLNYVTPNTETTLGTLILDKKALYIQRRSATVRESRYSTLVSTTTSVKHCDIVLQGLYTVRNTFYMRISNPCAMIYYP